MQQAILEKIQPDVSSSIRAFVYDESNFEAPYHFHPEYELTYIKSSSGLRYIGNTVEDYQAGELVLIGTNVPHCWKNKTGKTASSYVIQWKSDLIGNQPELISIKQLLSRATWGLRFNDALAEETSHIMRQIIKSTPLDSYVLLVQLLDQLSKTKDSKLILEGANNLAPTLEFSERLEMIQRYVDANYKIKIKLKDVASHLEMSEQAFSRYFSKTMGKPFFQFLNEYRINTASRLLLETQLSINEIGYSCGYETLPFFYRQFKKLKGQTPLNYRKERI